MAGEEGGWDFGQGLEVVPEVEAMGGEERSREDKAGTGKESVVVASGACFMHLGKCSEVEGKDLDEGVGGMERRKGSLGDLMDLGLVEG